MSRASLSQRVARIEVPPLSRRSQPQRIVRSPELSMRTWAVSLPLNEPAALLTRHSNGDGAIEPGVVGRDLDGADIVAARQARIAQPAHVRGEADHQQADAQQQDQPARNAGHAYARMVVMPPSTTSVWPVM